MAEEKKGLFDKVKETLGSEEKTDAILDKASDAAKKATGGKFDDKIQAVRDAADKKLGTE